jgi:hypothetical protein
VFICVHLRLDLARTHNLNTVPAEYFQHSICATASMSETEKKFLSLLTELLAVPCPSGREEKAAAVVRSHLERMGYAHETDGAGNVIGRLAVQDFSAPSCILAAHLDEIGIVVTGIADDGTLCVDRSGKLSPHKIGERPIEILGDTGSVTGILSFGSGHAVPGDKELSLEPGPGHHRARPARLGQGRDQAGLDWRTRGGRTRAAAAGHWNETARRRLDVRRSGRRGGHAAITAAVEGAVSPAAVPGDHCVQDPRGRRLPWRQDPRAT